MTEESSREKIVCVEGKIYVMVNSSYESIEPHIVGISSIFVSTRKQKTNKNKTKRVNQY